MRRAVLIVLFGLLLVGCGGEETISPTGPVVGTLPTAAKGDPAAGKTSFNDAGCGEVASGFQPDIMPQDYGSQLTSQQVADLVAFLQTG